MFNCLKYSNYIELESSGNIKIENMHFSDKHTQSIIELIKSRISQKFQTKNFIKNMNIMKMWKVTNKEHKIVFENNYDFWVDKLGKFGEEKKYYEYKFLYLNDDLLDLDFIELCNQILFNFSKFSTHNKLLLLSSFLDKFEDHKVSENKDKSSKFVICKCVNFPQLFHQNLSIYSEDLKLNEDLIKFYNNSSQIDKPINEIMSSDNNASLFLYPSEKMLCIPEYIIEYNYTYNNILLNNNIISTDKSSSFLLNKNSSGDNNFIISPYSKKLELKESFLEVFNQSCTSLYSSELSKYLNNETMVRNFSCKFEYLEDLEQSGFFLVRNSLLKFITRCFKFTNLEEFKEEFQKIYEKINEIQSLNFKMNSILTNPGILNNISFNQIKELNFFNAGVSEEFNIEKIYTEINEFALFHNIEKLSIVRNNIDDFEIIINLFKKFENLQFLDCSFNNIKEITKEQMKVLENLVKNNPKQIQLDISYNLISDCNIIEQLMAIFPGEKLFTFGNPLKVKNLPLINKEPGKQSFQQKRDFDITYYTYSFTNLYQNLDIPIFQTFISKEKLSNILILSKRKMIKIPEKIIPDDVDNRDIKILYLNHNKISIIENLFFLSISLVELYLQNNKFTSLKCCDIIFQNLIKLDISNNSLLDLYGVSSFPKLTWLNAENNFIQCLSIQELTKNCTQIEELLLSGNCLKNIKEIFELKNLNYLSSLDLTGNEVSKSFSDFRIYIIKYIPNLKILNRIMISKEEFQQSKEFFEGRLTNELLEEKFGTDNTLNMINVELSNCKLKDFENIFNSNLYPMMKKLDLSRNFFTSMKIFGHLPNLIELYLNSNQFEKLFNKKEKQMPQKGLLGISNIEILEMCDNNLSDMTGIQLLKNLKNLVLRENSLNKIDAIDGLVNLHFLDISFNKMRIVEKSNIGLMPTIRTLICDNNYLKNINAFSKLISLSFASFEGNKISEFMNIEKFLSCENLKVVNLNSNPIAKVHSYRNNMIKKFPNLVKIDGLEVSKEEREAILMEMYMNSTGEVMINPNNIVQTNNFPSNLQKNDKFPMKVNVVNLDLMSGFGGVINPQRHNSGSEKNIVNLAQLRMNDPNNDRNYHYKI
jgi:Leucine-rich repeat (LRR) protein